MPTRIIVLLSLKPNRASEEYERWVRSTDLPTVRRLNSIDDFKVYKTVGLLGGGHPPYDYIEVLDIIDMDEFSNETASVVMKQVAYEFSEWANASFIITSEIDL